MASDEELVARARMIAARAWKLKRGVLRHFPAWLQEEAYSEALCTVVCLLVRRWQIEDGTVQRIAMQQIDVLIQREWRHYQREGRPLLDEHQGETTEAATEGSPEELEMRMDVRDALAGLPAGLQQVAQLRFCDGYRVKDIAAMVGISRRTAERRIAKARRYLQQRLAVYRCLFRRNLSLPSSLSDSSMTSDLESGTEDEG